MPSFEQMHVCRASNKFGFTHGLHMMELMGPKWPLMLPISFSKILWKKTLWNFPDLLAVVVTLSADCPPPKITCVGCRISKHVLGDAHTYTRGHILRRKATTHVVHQGGNGGAINGTVRLVRLQGLECHGIVQLRTSFRLIVSIPSPQCSGLLRPTFPSLHACVIHRWNFRTDCSATESALIELARHVVRS